MNQAARPNTSHPSRRHEDISPADLRRIVVPAAIWGLGLVAIVVSELVATLPASQVSAAPQDAPTVFGHGA